MAISILNGLRPGFVESIPLLLTGWCLAIRTGLCGRDVQTYIRWPWLFSADYPVALCGCLVEPSNRRDGGYHENALPWTRPDMVLFRDRSVYRHVY